MIFAVLKEAGLMETSRIFLQTMLLRRALVVSHHFGCRVLACRHLHLAVGKDQGQDREEQGRKKSGCLRLPPLARSPTDCAESTCASPHKWMLSHPIDAAFIRKDRMLTIPIVLSTCRVLRQCANRTKLGCLPRSRQSWQRQETWEANWRRVLFCQVLRR